MDFIPLPPIELMRQLLEYESSTGLMTWLERSPDHYTDGKYLAKDIARRFNSTWAGKVAGVKAGPYYRIGLRGQKYLYHRVAWAIYHGTEPKGFVDHINGNGLDNRIENLRIVSNRENCHNAKMTVRNKSGFNGVSWAKRDKRWVAHARTPDRKTLRLGAFQDLEQAIACRQAFNEREGYHENHGKPEQERRGT